MTKKRQDEKSSISEDEKAHQALAQEYLGLRNAGLVVEAIPLAELHSDLLVRDRMAGLDADLADLMISLRDIGLSNPVRVQRRLNGQGYDLIQGYRRLEAFRLLLAETGDKQWATIPSLVVPTQDGIAHLYRQMIDENIVRKELSFAEMAIAARNFAADPATEAQTVSDAVPVLFQSANYAKRSYIRAFARLLDHIEGCVKFPTAIPRNLGMELLKQIEAKQISKNQIKAALSHWDNRSVSDELGVLKEMTQVAANEDILPELIEQKAMTSATIPHDKTTFDLRLPQGQVQCTATLGRLEIRANRNFSRIDRSNIERAVTTLMKDDL